jgi:quinol-cytochrome oxidoreductase complex cytochrome b subunit
MLEELRHWLLAYPTLDRSLNIRSERRIPMTKRQMAFGVICFLVGILVGMEIAGNLDVLVRIVIIVAILLLCVYLVLPYLSRRTRARRGPAQRVPQRRTQRKP